MPKALFNDTCRLEKMPGKGGWTYIRIDNIPDEKRDKGGHVRVKGSIDKVPIKAYRLMPMGKGKLLLPVKSEWRKQMGKEAGDFVKLVLYADPQPQDLPEELKLCLQEEPQAYKIFMSFTEGERNGYINWINAAKREQTKADRIAKTIERTLLGLNFWDRVERLF